MAGKFWFLNRLKMLFRFKLNVYFISSIFIMRWHLRTQATYLVYGNYFSIFEELIHQVKSLYKSIRISEGSYWFNSSNFWVEMDAQSVVPLRAYLSLTNFSLEPPSCICTLHGEAIHSALLQKVRRLKVPSDIDTIATTPSPPLTPFFRH